MFLQWLRNTFAPFRLTGSPPPGNGDLLRDIDDSPDIRELSRLMDDGRASSLAAAYPEHAEFFMILGNVFRAQGDIDRAVRLRESLLAHPGLGREQKALVFYELGSDYRKAGLYDRALYAYKESRRFGYAEDTISRELSLLAADSGDFQTAAAESAKCGNVQAEACYLVRQAEEYAARGKDSTAISLVKQALRVYPGSPEAWLRLACISLLGRDAQKACLRTQAALTLMDSSGRLIFLEGLHACIGGSTAPDIPPQDAASLAGVLRSFLMAKKSDVILCYYAGLFLHMGRNYGEAEQCFTKALVLDPEFWAARLAILDLAASREQLPLLLSQQIAFFVQQGSRAKRFHCLACGMHRDTIFSFCPRCRSWHSAAFRLRLT